MTPESLPVVHYVNPAFLLRGGELQPDKVESLVYANTPRGKVLIGAMYIMHSLGTPGPAVGGSLTPWHHHENLCFDTTTGVITALTNAAGKCPVGTDNQRTPDMLHVWVVDNPNGPFDPEMSPAGLAKLVRV